MVEIGAHFIRETIKLHFKETKKKIHVACTFDPYITLNVSDLHEILNKNFC